MIYGFGNGWDGFLCWCGEESSCPAAAYQRVNNVFFIVVFNSMLTQDAKFFG